MLRFAPDKLALLLSLVPYLDEVGVVSVAEAAAHFRVGESDIRDAVNLIAASGVPTVDNVAFDNDMFDIDWDSFLDDDVIVLTRSVVIDDAPRFSRGEASALIAGLQVLAGLPGSADNEILHGLIHKLALAGGAANLVALPAASEPVQREVARALTEQVQLEFEYTPLSGSPEPRRIDVLQIESDNDVWYVRGWCHDREALRVFRLDRMTHVHCTDRPAARTSPETPLSESLFDEAESDFDVVIESTRAGLTLLGDFVRGVAVPKTGDPVQLTIRVAHVHGLKRVMTAHPEHFRVCAPERAVRAVADWARAALETSDDDAGR